MKEIERASNFLRQIVADDLQEKRVASIRTRFPPEPNGFLHIGHAKAIFVSFEMAQFYDGECNLRLDDTNPDKEDQSYVDAIIADCKWLGCDWGDRLFYASDYYEKLFEIAVDLIKKDKAFVCSLNAQELKTYRGSLNLPGKESPDRNRSIEENLRLFQEMRDGKHEDGKYTLRAKIDMSSGNINLRDPSLYRIKRSHHYRQLDKWCIYPMYDFAHAIGDALEGISHSFCTLEFQDHRPLYDWCVENSNIPKPWPHQYEFARLNLTYAVTSKRKMKLLVDEKIVSGWDDPRMVTLAGLRRRGFTPSAIRLFCDRIGVSKKESPIEFEVLERALRDDLDEKAPRAFGIKEKIECEISNWPKGKDKVAISAPRHPKNDLGSRELSFAKKFFIDAEDFMMEPSPKFFRLSPGAEVRLRYAYIVKCENFETNASGQVTKLYLSCDWMTLGAKPEGRKVKGVIHWLSEEDALPCKFLYYDRLFNMKFPGSSDASENSFLNDINQNSMSSYEGLVEKSLVNAQAGEPYQLERLGFFTPDLESRKDKLIFNLSSFLMSTWQE